MAGFGKQLSNGQGMRHYQAGISHVGSYQIASHPYISGSGDMGSAGEEHRHSFDTVARSVTVINRSNGDASEVQGMTADIRVHFHATGSGHIVDGMHYIGLEGDGDSITLNMKCKEIFVSSNIANAAYTIIAELTSIPQSAMHDITGSGLTTIT
tara:strand:- start:743 stop:1204 length:462 start_codon:yes stop_codon:yes gene_type:complete